MSEDLDFTIITGLSGAGRSTAADVLEDLGYFVIDNVPPLLIPKVAELAVGDQRQTRYALVIDVRTGHFVEDLQHALEQLRELGARTRILFLDAADDALVTRFEATRRPHPLATQDLVSSGIAAERHLLEELKGQADVIVDTSVLNVHELRERLQDVFSSESKPRLQANIVSFGYKHGLPRDVDLVFDCRFIPNPHWIPELRPLTGLDEPVRANVMAQPETQKFVEHLRALLGFLLPAYVTEGKSYLSIGIGCTGGRHRSVVLGEELGHMIEDLGYQTRVHHRDVGRA
jgi:RNase adapter protein RapZ